MIRWRLKTMPIITMAMAFFWSSQDAEAASCRAEWNKYKTWPALPSGHKAFASQRTKGSPGSCYWYRSPDVDDVTRRAVEECNRWQAESCEIVSIDDKPIRPNLDAYFNQKSYAPVAIEIHDNVSGKTEKVKGFALFEPDDSDDSTTLRLITEKKAELCVGRYDQPGFLSNHFEVSGRCFKNLSFTNEINATGYRYIDHMKVGFSFDAKFELNGSYIRVVSQ